MSEQTKREVEQLVEKNRQLIESVDVDRDRRREDAQRARESLRRAQRLIRKAATG